MGRDNMVTLLRVQRAQAMMLGYLAATLKLPKFEQQVVQLIEAIDGYLRTLGEVP